MPSLYRTVTLDIIFVLYIAKFLLMEGIVINWWSRQSNMYANVEVFLFLEIIKRKQSPQMKFVLVVRDKQQLPAGFVNFAK